MFEHVSRVVAEAESAANAGEDLNFTVLPILRGISMEEFAELLMVLPDERYPALSMAFPAMASDKTQTTWTGSSGYTLLRQTASFVRLLEAAYSRVCGENLPGKTILDFGVGWGRILRPLYYFTSPNNLWGIDAWERSLETCRDAGVLGNLRLSQSVPTTLPVGTTQFDLGYAFSVFTHLAPSSAEACLAAVRKAMKSDTVFVATVRPVEFWAHFDKQRGLDVGAELAKKHSAEGFAYLPHGGQEGETYGDATYSREWLSQQPGWKVVGYDWSRVDAYQVAMILLAI